MNMPLAHPHANYAPELLACPHCRGDLTPDTSGLTCNKCHASYFFTDGFINLITDPELKTQLIEKNYDAEHGLNEKRRLSNWNIWEWLLIHRKVNFGKVLEIGAGSGLLTWGLLHHSTFEEIHISDISPSFLRMIASDHDPGNKKSHYYLCDANQLPFQEDSMDCVLGNSALHHFVNYEQTLISTYTVLKPGGKAFFFEPVRNGKAFVALITKLLFEIDSRSPNPFFTREQHKQLQRISYHIANQATRKCEKTNIEHIKNQEDKYIFDIQSLKRLARKIGYVNLYIENLQDEDWSYWLYVSHQLELAGFDRNMLEHYRYLFNSVRDTYAKMMPESMTTPMVYLVFEK